MHPDVSPSVLISLCNTENTTEQNTNHNKNLPNAAQLHQITDRREDGETAWERMSWHGGTADVQSTCGELASAPDDFTVNHSGTSNKSRKSKIHLLYSHLLLDLCDGNDGSDGSNGNNGNDGSSKVQMLKHQLRLVELKTRQLWPQRSFYL